MTTPAPTIEQVRHAWDAIAPRFDDVITPLSMQHGAEVLHELPLGPGTQVLDVACGTGALAIPAARRGASVLGVDLAPAMIELLRTRADAEGLTTLQGRVMDCHALDLPDDSVDIAASQNGITMSPRLDLALAEMVRVTRPGGTVLVAAFGPLPQVEFLSVFTSALTTAVPDGPGLPPEPPPPFQLADTDAFADRLRAAGLREVAVRTVTWEMPIASADDLWAEVTSSNPIGAQLVAGLTPAQREDVLHVIDGMIRERSGGQPGTVLRAAVNIGTGTV